jgi:hypothetical protein
MRFILLLYDDSEQLARLPREQVGAIVGEHLVFRSRLRERGALVLGEPVGDGGRVLRRRSDGSSVVSDGPFAETKEQLGGFYVVECESLDAAVALGREVPASPGLVVEIRPLPPPSDERPAT